MRQNPPTGAEHIRLTSTPPICIVTMYLDLSLNKLGTFTERKSDPQVTPPASDIGLSTSKPKHSSTMRRIFHLASSYAHSCKIGNPFSWYVSGGPLSTRCKVPEMWEWDG